MKLSQVLGSHQKVKVVFIDFVLFKKGVYITVYPSGKTYPIQRFFKYFDDKDIKPEKIEKNLIDIVYVKDTLL
ncbi:hypothetical protein [Caldisphaera sp.]|uniref:hypothetical protein n=1 Tax=Caldisphaera sp. TaxID=2060322 RepID=UPI0025BC6599|nr:hypothetical protein [Caldisphaera sp.]